MEKLPFDPKPTKDNRKTPIAFRGAWMSPIMCLYNVHHNNPRFWQESMKAARDTNGSEDLGKYIDKYL